VSEYGDPAQVVALDRTRVLFRMASVGSAVMMFVAAFFEQLSCDPRQCKGAVMPTTGTERALAVWNSAVAGVLLLKYGNTGAAKMK